MWFKKKIAKIEICEDQRLMWHWRLRINGKSYLSEGYATIYACQDAIKDLTGRKIV